METLSAKCKRFRESWTSSKELALQRRHRNHQTYSLELNICSNMKNRMFRKKKNWTFLIHLRCFLQSTSQMLCCSRSFLLAKCLNCAPTPNLVFLVNLSPLCLQMNVSEEGLASQWVREGRDGQTHHRRQWTLQPGSTRRGWLQKLHI